MFDRHKTNLGPSSEPQNLSGKSDSDSNAKQKELGAEYGLKDISGVTTRTLVAFGKHGITPLKILPIARPMISMAGAKLRMERPSGIQVSSVD